MQQTGTVTPTGISQHHQPSKALPFNVDQLGHCVSPSSSSTTAAYTIATSRSVSIISRAPPTLLVRSSVHSFRRASLDFEAMWSLNWSSKLFIDLRGRSLPAVTQQIRPARGQCVFPFTPWPLERTL